MLNRTIKFFIENRLVASILLLVLLMWGVTYSPFTRSLHLFPDAAVAVDAIPDIGENQQIVYTEWPGQSPQDIEDQISYPLTSSLLGTSGVKTIRSSSMFGFSSIYIIFEDDVDYYWSRSRIVEKLNSLNEDLLPNGVKPTLGPEATAMGQLFWYTLEGRDSEGKVTGGWDLQETRSVQDFYVKNALLGASGVAEIASIGGHVKEYQVDLIPELLKQYGISLQQVADAIRNNNRDTGAKTLEINKVEYFVRGLGSVESLKEIENIQVVVNDFTPIFIRDIARVSTGPAERRGILDKKGAEVTGGVVVARYGANPMEVIRNVKSRIKEISGGMPSKILADGKVSKLTIVPFYDRSGLIKETLNTLQQTLTFEILITVLVIVIMLRNLRISMLVSLLMPTVVLTVFIAMKIFKVDANILSLSGIAIAIGTIVDFGIILTENIIRHMELQKKSMVALPRLVYKATKEVSGAIITAGLTTIVSFIPVFMLSGTEGKLFTPLAFTKTVALFAAIMVALLLLPPFTILLFQKRRAFSIRSHWVDLLFIALGIAIMILFTFWGVVLVFYGGIRLLNRQQQWEPEFFKRLVLGLVVFTVIAMLGIYWRPLGFSHPLPVNIAFVGLCALLILGLMFYFRKFYTNNLRWALENKWFFLAIPIILILFGVLFMSRAEKEFMPSLDEGSFLLMPTSMPHTGIEEAKNTLRYLDMAVVSLPEIETVVGKAGRASTAIDPAPLSMYENVIIYKPEFILDEKGRPLTFKVNEEGLFATNDGQWIESGAGIDASSLVQEPGGEFYRNWREHIRSRNDIWEEIVRVTAFPGVTSAPKLQPIETRLVMLQTGMRASMGIKIKGLDLEEMQDFGLQLENILKTVPGIKPGSVFADRIIGKPYLELKIDQKEIARYGLSVNQVQEVLETAIGGKILSETIEGRERYGIRLRYPRELRASPEDLGQIYVTTNDGLAVPLQELVDFNYRKGPQNIKSEDGFLVSYLVFDREKELSDLSAVSLAKEYIQEHVEGGLLEVPEGISYKFSGNYENQLRAEKRLSIVVPLVLLAILLILFFQFRSWGVSIIVFTGIAVAFAGGFILIGLYSQPWFMDIDVGYVNLRDLFNIKVVHLSVAVWVGFIALFGIATDDGVVMATYMQQVFRKNEPESIQGIRDSVVEAANRRIRACLMITATTLLALLPILTSTGRGSDVMIPMAIPAFGGVFMTLVNLFVVPVLYAMKKENDLKKLKHVEK